MLHKSSEGSSLVSGPRLNSPPPGAKNPASYRSATTFHLGGSSRILQDKVRMLGALVLYSPSEHVFHCTLLTLWVWLCEWMNEMPCANQVKSPALQFHSDLIWLMAETCQGFIPTCQCQEAPNVSFRNRPEWTKHVDRTLLSRSNFSVSLTIS